MLLNSSSWKQLIFYGEVVGFVLAWVVGIAVTLQSRPEESQMAGVEHVAVVTDLRGSGLE